MNRNQYQSGQYIALERDGRNSVEHMEPQPIGGQQGGENKDAVQRHIQPVQKCLIFPDHGDGAPSLK